jgi:hypothetical protein
MVPAETLETGAAALLFGATFLFGGRVHPLRALDPDRRRSISFCGGMSAAYVFVHLMPELHGVRSAFVESVSASLRYEGMAIYFLALVGFLAFYGLDHLRARLSAGEAEREEGSAFRIHIGGFAAYVALMAYLLVHNLEETAGSTILYTVAIVVHFLAMDHALREEHGVAYQRIGRFVLAGACLLGWGVGLLVALPHHVLALLVAFISGSIIVNSLIMELPSEKDGRFLPFMAGGLVYGLILLPLGS